MSRGIKKPSVVSMPVWKVIFGGIGGSILWVFLIWLFNFVLSMYRTGIPRPVTIGDILLGSVWLWIGFWTRWAYQVNRRHRRWHVWLESVFIGVYITLLLLCGGIAYWNALLGEPWNWVVNIVSIVLFALVWVFPAISFTFAKRITAAQDNLGLTMLKFGGPATLMIIAGTLGANFGMHGSRDSKILFIAFLFSVISIGLAQYFAVSLWPSRPWAKEEE